MHMLGLSCRKLKRGWTSKHRGSCTHNKQSFLSRHVSSLELFLYIIYLWWVPCIGINASCCPAMYGCCVHHCTHTSMKIFRAVFSVNQNTGTCLLFSVDHINRVEFDNRYRYNTSVINHADTHSSRTLFVYCACNYPWWNRATLSHPPILLWWQI